MKKALALILALCMVFSFAACGTKEEAKTEDTTTQLEDKLVIYATHTDEEMEAFTAYFREQHPDVEVDIVNGTFGELMARVQAESAAPVADIVIGGLNSATGQEYVSLFEPYVGSHDDELIAKTSNGYFNCVLIAPLHLAVNTKLEAEAGLSGISSYDDLLDPKLYGKIVMADPNSSSSAWNNVMNMMMVYGIDSDAAWDYIEKLMRNGLVVVSSSSTTFKGVYQGEYTVGITYESGAATIVAAGGENFEIRYFDEGSIAIDSCCAVVKDAPHMNAAKEFVECITSKEGQELGNMKNAAIRLSNKNTVNSNPDAFLCPNSEVKFIDWDAATLVEKKADILAKWNALYAEVQGK